MQYSEYGRSGKRVSAVGFGGMRFDLSRSHEENADLVRYASSLGINYFDTAPGYGDGESEIIFGKAFTDMPNPFYVSTKGMPVFYDTAEKTRELVQQSLERMGVPVIHFYHVWCLRKMEHYALAMRPGGMYDGLLQCKEEGLIEHIAFSSHQPGSEIKQILDEGKMEGVLLGMNILNYPYRWDGVQAAHESGYGVVAMNPLSGGMIPQHEDRFAFLASPGETPTEAALRFVISCPQITVALNGFTTREQVEMACRIAEKSKPFTDADRARIAQHLTENLNAICTACGYCTGCPQQIPVAGYMQYFNTRQMFGADDKAMVTQLRHDLSWGILVGRQAEAVDCTECGHCEEACTQHLPIIERLKEIARFEADIAGGQGKV